MVYDRCADEDAWEWNVCITNASEWKWMFEGCELLRTLSDITAPKCESTHLSSILISDNRNIQSADTPQRGLILRLTLFIFIMYLLR